VLRFPLGIRLASETFMNHDIVIKAGDFVEFISLGVTSGYIAGFIMRTQLPLTWVFCAGLASVVLEPWAHVSYGPLVFNHSLLATTALSGLVILAGRLIQLICNAWYYQHR
jgi:MFS superfamily sulfate permease-like transporter